jgi:LytS/YehU family sensor histidine kinase
LIYFFAPKFLLKKKYIYFFLGLFLLIGICSIYAYLTQVSISGIRDSGSNKYRIGRNILPFIHAGGIALSIKLLKNWYIQKQQTLEAEKQKAVAELKLLRAQLHPHFLFNTLNNLYSHTLEQSSNAPDIVLKLSALLRFMIYESNVSRIPLEKEIELLKNYIALEQMRYGDWLDISVSVSGNIKHHQIAPLILLPFLENAFKHGTSKQIDQCWISLDITVKESLMQFKLVNSIEPINKKKKKKVGGLGLQNVERRLELLYKDKHRFETILESEVFIVNLDINLEVLEDKFTDLIN